MSDLDKNTPNLPENPENPGTPEPEAPDKKTLVHQWIGLLVGIPLFIMAIYVVIHMLYSRG